MRRTWGREMFIRDFQSLGTHPSGATELVTDDGTVIKLAPEAAQALVVHLLQASTLRLVPVINPRRPFGWNDLLKMKEVV